MSRVIEALDRKRKCTNYRDGLSWRSIGGRGLVGARSHSDQRCVCVVCGVFRCREIGCINGGWISLAGEGGGEPASQPASRCWYDVQGICPSGLIRV